MRGRLLEQIATYYVESVKSIRTFTNTKSGCAMAFPVLTLLTTPFYIILCSIDPTSQANYSSRLSRLANRRRTGHSDVIASKLEGQLPIAPKRIIFINSEPALIVGSLWRGKMPHHLFWFHFYLYTIYMWTEHRYSNIYIHTKIGGAE